MFTRGLVPLLLLGALACCSSLDRKVTLAPSDRVVVICYQPATRGKAMDHDVAKLQQTLAAIPEADRVEFYSQRESDPLTKFISTEAMQLLLDAFATGGYFDHASEMDSLPQRSALIVDINGRKMQFGRSPAFPPEVHGKYTVCWTAFQDIYNATKAYRTGVGANSVLKEHAEQIRGRGGRR